jgi:hypothetical protein
VNSILNNSNLDIVKYVHKLKIKTKGKKDYLNQAIIFNDNLSIIKYLAKHFKLKNIYPLLQTDLDEENDPDNIHFVKELIHKYKQSVPHEKMLDALIENSHELTRKIINNLTIKEFQFLANLNADVEELIKPENKITYVDIDCELNDSIIINNKSYAINKQIIMEKCKEFDFLFNFELVDNTSTMEINIDNVQNDIVELYINSFFMDQFEKIEKLSTEKLIELCRIVDKYPNNINIEKLEYFLCLTFNKKYLYYYLEILTRYKLYDLKRIINKNNFSSRLTIRNGQNLKQKYNIEETLCESSCIIL